VGRRQHTANQQYADQPACHVADLYRLGPAAQHHRLTDASPPVLPLRWRGALLRAISSRISTRVFNALNHLPPVVVIFCLLFLLFICLYH